jgi:hypothetical protein
MASSLATSGDRGLDFLSTSREKKTTPPAGESSPSMVSNSPDLSCVEQAPKGPKPSGNGSKLTGGPEGWVAALLEEDAFEREELHVGNQRNTLRLASVILLLCLSWRQDLRSGEGCEELDS